MKPIITAEIIEHKIYLIRGQKVSSTAILRSSMGFQQRFSCKPSNEIKNVFHRILCFRLQFKML
jgi:hypothetical protein